MLGMHLRQLIFTCSTFGSSTKNNKRLQKFKETVDSMYNKQKELGKACFQRKVA